jgi:hypothetical protein
MDTQLHQTIYKDELNDIKEPEITEWEDSFEGEQQIQSFQISEISEEQKHQQLEFSRSVESFIVQTFKYESYMQIEDKINFSFYIINNKIYLLELSEFYEEECHLSLVNWIFKYKNIFKNDYTMDERIKQLIYNILIIFEIFPIKTKDLFSLKIFQKLNKIRKYMKNMIQNRDLDIENKLKRLLDYWQKFIDQETEILLNKKRTRANFVEEEEEFSNSFKKVFFIFNFLV